MEISVMVGTTGVGGGALMTPILVLVFGVTTVTAVGTDLWFAAFTKIIGGLAYFRHDSIDWEVFRRLCLGSLPTSVLTSIWIHSADVGQTKQGLLLALLGCVLILTAIAIVFKERMQSWGRRIRSLSPVEFKRAQREVVTPVFSRWPRLDISPSFQ